MRVAHTLWRPIYESRNTHIAYLKKVDSFIKTPSLHTQMTHHISNVFSISWSHFKPIFKRYLTQTRVSYRQADMCIYRQNTLETSAVLQYLQHVCHNTYNTCVTTRMWHAFRSCIKSASDRGPRKGATQSLASSRLKFWKTSGSWQLYLNKCIISWTDGERPCLYTRNLGHRGCTHTHIDVHVQTHIHITSIANRRNEQHTYT